MKKIVVVSRGQQGTEKAVIGSSMLFHLFDFYPDGDSASDLSDSLIRLQKRIKKEKIGIAIFDNCFVPRGTTGITVNQMLLAEKLKKEYCMEIFFSVIGENAPWGNELWRAFKPIQYRNEKTPAGFALAKLSVFGSETFSMKEDTVMQGSDDFLTQSLRNDSAFKERDWPRIKKCVEEELK